MPFTRKFFLYQPSQSGVAADTARLQQLYSNIPPVYFEDWLDTQPENVKEAYAKEHKVSDIETLKTSHQYQQSWQQIKTLIHAIQAWANKNSIKAANNWSILLKRLFNESSYLPDQDIPKWLSRGKKAWEQIYLLLEYSNTISLPQKNR